MYFKMAVNVRTRELIQVFIALLFLLFMIMGAHGDDAIAIRCFERERNALLQFKDDVVSNVERLSSWMGEDCCKWKGVGCSNLTGHVVFLDLHAPGCDLPLLSDLDLLGNGSADFGPCRPLQLRGKLEFSSLVELNHLTYLDLSYNDFDGLIPEVICSFRQLRHLNLFNSGFTGKIPLHIGNLSQLETLNLGNNFALDLENLEWLSNLRYIRYLDLSGIDLSSFTSLEPIRNLSFLTELHLGSCDIISPLTPLTNSSYLQTLDLSLNAFSTVRDLEWLSNLVNLRYLDLSDIDLSKTNWLQPIQKLPFLTELLLSRCQIHSPLPSLTNSSYLPFLAVIDLSSNDFNSSQPLYWLYNLSSSLEVVNLQYNNFRGPIPDVFSNMIFLTELALGACSLEGVLPESFGNLTDLQVLLLGNNSLTGNFSEVLNKWSEGAKNSIVILDLSSNELSGALPDFSRFSSLKDLRVPKNKLNDPFPESFVHHPNLVYLDISGNRITGSLPNQLSLPKLEYLNLSNNTLRGRLPESIGQFSELYTMDVSSNSLEDTITEIHFMKLSKLKNLYLSFNSLVFSVSADWIPPFQLSSIVLCTCKLGPHFPKWLQTQKSIYELQLPHTNVSDAVPNWFWNLTSELVYLNLAGNQMSGVIPDLSSNFPSLMLLDLSSNQFNGPLPLVPPTVESLYLSRNRFVGSISSLCNISSIKEFDVSDNLLSGELPDCWKLIDQLKILNLDNNNFTGKIPSSLGFLNNLQSLHLRKNNFIGELPSALQGCTMLRIVDLSGNNLLGRIPEWIGIFLEDVIILSLSLNRFYGSIPSNICNLNHIQVLDLSRNMMSGDVPRCFNKLTSLIGTSGLVVIPARMHYYFDGNELGYFEHTVVQWKGQTAEYGRKILKLLKIIDLSSNKLTGKIPNEFTSLVGLQSLNLSRNHFTGNIPQKIGQMKNLESLDLSRNFLSGKIPLGLGNVASLSMLDLSNNNLFGKIPPGTQLEGFNSSCFAGNLQLCGLPLPNRCPGDEVANVPPTSKDKKGEEDEDELITTGFYVSLVLGFAVGFWGIFGTLQLKHSWRRAFFQFLSDMNDKVYVAAAVNLARIRRILGG